MIQIVLESWQEGLEKVSLTKLQMNKLGISLKEAKSNVDSLLEGEKVTISVASNELAQGFIEEASKIGVVGSITK